MLPYEDNEPPDPGIDIDALDMIMISFVLVIVLVIGLCLLASLAATPTYTGPASDCMRLYCL